MRFPRDLRLTETEAQLALLLIIHPKVSLRHAFDRLYADRPAKERPQTFDALRLQPTRTRLRRSQVRSSASYCSLAACTVRTVRNPVHRSVVGVQPRVDVNAVCRPASNAPVAATRMNQASQKSGSVADCRFGFAYPNCAKGLTC